MGWRDQSYVAQKQLLKELIVNFNGDGSNVTGDKNAAKPPSAKARLAMLAAFMEAAVKAEHPGPKAYTVAPEGANKIVLQGNYHSFKDLQMHLDSLAVGVLRWCRGYGWGPEMIMLDGEQFSSMKLLL